MRRDHSDETSMPQKQVDGGDAEVPTLQTKVGIGASGLLAPADMPFLRQADGGNATPDAREKMRTVEYSYDQIRESSPLRHRIADLENQLEAANQEIHRFVSECARCGCHGQKAEHTNYCPECLAWYREEWGRHSPCAKESVLTDELQAAKKEIALLTDKLIAAGNAKADAKEKLMEMSGIDSGSVEAEAREKIQQIGYAETLRRVGDCGTWSLTWESVSNILELLQEGIISRRKAHESLNSVLHGDSLNLPPLENCAFDDVELPGETVRTLRDLLAQQAKRADEAKAALKRYLAATPAEALEDVRRKAQIEALTNLECWRALQCGNQCRTFFVAEDLCPRCKALDALKGGK